MTRALIAALLLGALGLTHSGCSHKSAHRVSSGENFRVDNRSNDTIDVYVDYGRVGEVRPGEEILFDVHTGYRPVHFREHGHSHLDYQGDYFFDGDTVLELVYDPGTLFNFRVFNDDGDTIHVYVDGSSVGHVDPGESRTWLVSAGTRDVAFRESGQPFAVHYGDFNFGANTLVEITYDN